MSAGARSLTVVALGGHALLDPDRPPTVPNQFAVCGEAVASIADLVARGARLVLTHGNGPQVGFMALRSELASSAIHEVPLDSLVADTQGALGYMVERALRDQLEQRGLRAEVATVVTEVEVDPADRHLKAPSKPIGRFHTAAEAEALSARGWTLAEYPPRGWRRVVASPEPTGIVQLPTIRRLVDAGVVTICCGGGGIPVTRDATGRVVGVEGVVDKDLASALLGLALGADRLVLTTEADGVYEGWGGPARRRLPSATAAELQRLVDRGEFPAGSMGPKVDACLRFVRGGGEAFVCRPADVAEALAGRAGTRITQGESP